MLVALLPDVAELGYPEKALEAARSIPTPADRALALGGISPYMPPERWPDLLQASLAIEEDESKAAFLAGLAPILPQELVAEVLAAARQIESPTARLQALVPLAVRVSQNPLDDALYSLWRDILHLLSRGTRRDLLGYVPVLASVMVALRDSDQIIKDIVHSVIRVSRSWP
jgi:hypothetical protein